MRIVTVMSAGLLATALALPAMAEGSKDMAKAKMQQSEVQKSGKLQRTTTIRQHRAMQANASMTGGRTMSSRVANANASAEEPVMEKYPTSFNNAFTLGPADPVCKPGQRFKAPDGETHRCQ